MEGEYDVLIIGAGPAGLAAACAAQDAGLSYLVIERSGIVQSLVQHPQQIRYFSPSDELAIGGIPFPMAGGHKPTREDALAYYRAVASARKLALATWERVTAVEREDVRFRVRSVTRVARPGIVFERRARYLIVCTGTFQHPRRLGVPGDELPNVLYALDDPTPSFGRKVLVAGGGNSAATAGMTLAEAGALVTVAMRRPPVDFQSHLRPFIVRDLKIMADEKRLTLLTEVAVAEVLPDRVLLRRTEYGDADAEMFGDAWEMETDFVFALIGQEADREFFAMLGVPLAPDGLPVYDDNAETPVPGIYVAGSLSRANIILESRRRAVEIVARIAAEMGR
jgi:thioredoxin reductase (NADPH)